MPYRIFIDHNTPAMFNKAAIMFSSVLLAVIATADSGITWIEHAPEIQSIALWIFAVLCGTIWCSILILLWVLKAWLHKHEVRHEADSEGIQEMLLRLTKIETQHNFIIRKGITCVNAVERSGFFEQND